MKIKYLFLAIATGIFAASCNGDDEISPSQLVASPYNGYTWTSFFNGTYTQLAQNETVNITANEDGTAKVILTSNTWGTSTILAATVTVGTNGYTISGTGTSAITGMGGTVNTYNCELRGTISTDKSEVEIVFTIPDVMQGTTITFRKGDAPAHLVVAGSYKGYTDMDCRYFQDMITTDQTITITANEDGTANVTYGNNTISNVEVKVSAEGVYTLSGAGVYAMSMSGPPTNYDCTLAGTINADKSEVEIAFTIPAVMQGTTITFRNGDAPAHLVVAGSYNGYTDMDSRYFQDMITTDQTITITANEDGTVNVTYGDNTISNVEVKVSAEGVYTLSGAGVYAMSMSGAPTNYDCTLAGTISKDKSKVEIAFTLPAVMGGTTITFRNGDAPATTE